MGETFIPGQLRVLMSYEHFKNRKDFQRSLPLIRYFKDHGVPMILDSGAFTAFMRGLPITLSEYMDFLEKHGHWFDWYFTLDRILSPKLTKYNYEKMLLAGYKPVPILTLNAPLEDVDWYYSTSDKLGVPTFICNRKYQYRELSSLQEYSFRRNTLHEIVQRAGGRRLHLLGAGTSQIVLTYRPYSCDSTTLRLWAAFRTPSFRLFSPGVTKYGHTSEGRFVMKKGRFSSITPRILMGAQRWGFSEEEILHYFVYGKTPARQSPFGVYVNPILWHCMTEAFKRIKVLEETTGTRIYHASVSECTICSLFAMIYEGLGKSPEETIIQFVEKNELYKLYHKEAGLRGLRIVYERMKGRSQNEGASGDWAV